MELILLDNKEAIEWIKADLGSLKLVEPTEPCMIKQKEHLVPALKKACLALEFQNSLIKDLISFEKIADVENAVNTKSAINSYRIMLERRLNGKQ